MIALCILSQLSHRNQNPFPIPAIAVTCILSKFEILPFLNNVVLRHEWTRTYDLEEWRCSAGCVSF
jgi:hypothetical protein